MNKTPKIGNSGTCQKSNRLDATGRVRNLPRGMTRAEKSALLEPATFKPFVLVTHAGRFRVPHPDFIDIPPHDAEEPEPSFIVVYTKTGTPRFVVLSSIDHTEVEPITSS